MYVVDIVCASLDLAEVKQLRINNGAIAARAPVPGAPEAPKLSTADIYRTQSLSKQAASGPCSEFTLVMVQ